MDWLSLPFPLAAFFNQMFEPHDIVIVALLVILEGVLSVDNALVLGLLAKRLPKHQQSRALTYGLVGAFVFRLIAITMATWLLHWPIVKLLGGGYLVYVSLKHFLFERHQDHVETDAQGEPHLIDNATGQAMSFEQETGEIKQRVVTPVPKSIQQGLAAFWPTVFVIEMTDIAFAVDSILAAIAMVPTPPGHARDAINPKLWVVFTGGFLGVILMRFAAVLFIKLLERFPRFEISAYLLVLVIGGKLLADWGLNSPEHPHVVNFHSPGNPAFWIFWGLMAVSFAIGFIPRKSEPRP